MSFMLILPTPRRHARKAPLRLIFSLLASTALVVNPVLAAEILPNGGSVASGEVTVGTSGSTMTVTQGSDKAIVNWNSFSIGESNSVIFVQPDAASAILNRVTGDTPSTIAGTLSANGQVFLINPNGIAITSTGTVKVGGGFVASSLDISDEDFLDGNLTFNGNGSSAGVSNEGIITIGRGGYAALMGGTVKNDGLIAVPLGKVGLGSGEQATLDLSGDGFLQVALPTEDGAEGDGALVENSGTISANGGTVVMKAATAKNAARHAINMSGVVEANTVSGSNGAITFGGGAGGKVTMSGKVNATAQTGKGGSIKVTGHAIELAGATIDASGSAGGGSVKIGGDWHGDGDMQIAATLSVDADTLISADATVDGNGGEVVLWSDELTSFAGTITAIGAGTGSGGNAEVSGKATLAYTGYTNLYGPAGYGTLLLDPYNITISSDTASNSSGTTATGDDSIINVDTLTTALASANVEITTNSGGSQDGDITVSGDIAWSTDTTLTLIAAGDINIGADITATGASAGLVMTYVGDYSISSGSSITLSGASAGLTINSQVYTLIHSMSELDAIDSTGLGAYYALAEDLDASGTTYTEAVVGVDYSHEFTGTFAGLGHTISDLTVDTGSSSYVGLFGYSSDTSTIRDIGLLDVSVSGGSRVGGLVGENAGTISNAYASGYVSGTGNDVGGLVGRNFGTISNAYATGNVTGEGNYVGGLVGYNGNNGDISTAYATGTVTGSSYYVGGLVGQNYGGTISTAYATGTVTGGSNVGGLIGRNKGPISNAYATGTVTGNNYVGGLVGYSFSGTISNAYASGAVSSEGYVGGLVGLNYSGTITDSFWDTETTGQSSSAGGGTGLTALQARDASNYSGWDFSDVWYQTGDMRPILRSEASTAVDGVISVSNLHQLALIGADLSASYILTADIDASETASSDDSSSIWGAEGFVPLGDDSTAFSGTFEGDGHTISNLTVDTSSSYAGLFGYSSDTSNIRDIGLLDVSVSGNGYVGGLIGRNYGGTISNAYATGAVTGSGNYVGGLVGENDGGTISNAYASGYVLGTGNDVGGLVGGSAYGGTISYAYASVDVSGANDVGGLAGSNAGTISYAYATGTVTGISDYVGGLVGLNSGSISYVYARGTVTGDYHVGGLVGQNYGGTISNAYATGAVTGSGNYVGGLVGSNTGAISTAYATGTVSGTSDYVGGLVGLDFGTITASFWDTETTGQSSSDGGTGLTTTDFQDTTGFMTRSGWDFSTIWAPSSSGYYPELYALSSIITVTVDDASMSYGNSVPTLTSSIYGGGTSYYVFGDSGDSLGAVDLTTSATSSSNVGTYAISVNKTTLTSTNGIVYRVVSLDGTLTINARAITVTADNLSRSYGDTNPTLTYNVTTGSLVNNDTLVLTTAADTSSSVGDYTIALGTNSNYDVSYTAGTLTVNARAITVTAKDQSRSYGDANPTLTYVVGGDGLVNGDVLSGLLTTQADTQSEAGDYAITQGTLSASSNYDVSFTQGTLSISANPAVPALAGILSSPVETNPFSSGAPAPSQGAVSAEGNSADSALPAQLVTADDGSSQGAGDSSDGSSGESSGEESLQVGDEVCMIASGCAN